MPGSWPARSAAGDRGGRATGAGRPGLWLLGSRLMAGSGLVQSLARPGGIGRTAELGSGPLAVGNRGNHRGMDTRRRDVPGVWAQSGCLSGALLVRQPRPDRPLVRHRSQPDHGTGHAGRHRTTHHKRIGSSRRAVGMLGISRRRLASTGRDRPGGHRDRQENGLFFNSPGIAAYSCRSLLVVLGGFDRFRRRLGGRTHAPPDSEARLVIGFRDIDDGLTLESLRSSPLKSLGSPELETR